MFRQTEFVGYDVQSMEKYYDENYNELKKRGKSDEEADSIAKFFVDFYLHTFRKYA